MNNIDLQLINSISTNNKTQSKKKLNKTINNWYNRNKKDIDRLFSLLLKAVDNNSINLNEDLKDIYYNFIMFVYKKSDVFI
uniref:Uncharacterized protein n=1 Tax=viral metagenome TaxID=1070528 RepID=A0A6C0EIY0_9ZZZZ|tara:strand:- start:109 stop:351 length:243 start_codon:yes stop_codon:yes gene_type:complete